MKKIKQYPRTRFSSDVIRDAISIFRSLIDKKVLDQASMPLMNIEIDGAEWQHDSEDEFFADYRRSNGSAYYDYDPRGFRLKIHQFGNTSVTVTAGAPDRWMIEKVFDAFDKHALESQLPEPSVSTHLPTIFIGHGRSPLWRDLKDHLQDKHVYSVQAYEIGARAGHTIRNILEDLLDRSTFAILVMTGEDETSDGSIRPRQNVVHEAGLFQGRLGFSRAIVLLEHGTEEFSNIHGIDQIRFSKGNIKETFGEILATLRREFANSST